MEMIAHPLYLHLETDDELRERCFAIVGRWGDPAMEFAAPKGVELENLAWDRCKIRRRIVEREA